MTKELIEKKSGEIQVQTTPQQLLAIAVNKDADVDKLAKLMELQIRWEDREAEKAYNEASLAFRNECPVIKKTLAGHNSKYAGLAETIEQIKPLLKKHGLSYTWKTSQDSGITSVTCKVTHIAGHSEETTLSASADKSGSKNDIQAIGSTVSYLERYTLFAVLGLTSSEMDTDGNTPAPDVTAEEINDLENLIIATDSNLEKFLAFYKIDTLGEIDRQTYKKALKALKSKKQGGQ